MRNPRQAKPVTLATHYFVGAMVVGMVERGEGPEERLRAAMDRFLDREQDRVLFELSPRPSRQEP